MRRPFSIPRSRALAMAADPTAPHQAGVGPPSGRASGSSAPRTARRLLWHRHRPERARTPPPPLPRPPARRQPSSSVPSSSPYTMLAVQLLGLLVIASRRTRSSGFRDAIHQDLADLDNANAASESFRSIDFGVLGRGSRCSASSLQRLPNRIASDNRGVRESRSASRPALALIAVATTSSSSSRLVPATRSPSPAARDR